jgi:phosphatidylserine/phosphatidylglycerophosphate/cardiolipin synthase-like enzyme
MTAVVAAGALVPLCLATTANATSLSASRATASLGLLVEPGQIAAVDSVLTSPQHTLDMTMYELADPVAEADLAADAARGVTVRVVLDRNREGAANTPAYEYLSAGHQVRTTQRTKRRSSSTPGTLTNWRWQ